MTIETQPWNRLWVLHRPDAHPHWNWYYVTLVDLTTDVGEPPTLYAPFMSHEMVVYAMNPQYDREIPENIRQAEGTPLTMLDVANWRERGGVMVLMPPNHVYQIGVENNAAAEDVIQRQIINRIFEGHLNPDTDFIRVWDAIFKGLGGVSARNAHKNMPSETGHTSPGRKQ